MLITTQMRANAANHQTDVTEAHSVLKSSQSQHKSFSELAEEHKALPLDAHTALKTQNAQITGEPVTTDAASAISTASKAAQAQGKLTLTGAFNQTLNSAMNGIASNAMSQIIAQSPAKTANVLNSGLGDMLSSMVGQSLGQIAQANLGNAMGSMLKDTNLAGLTPELAQSAADQAIQSQLSSLAPNLGNAAQEATHAALQAGMEMVDGDVKLLAKHTDNAGVQAGMQRAVSNVFDHALSNGLQQGLQQSLGKATQSSLKQIKDTLPTPEAPTPAEHGLNQGKTRELTAPHLLLHGVAGIEVATPKTTHIAANQHIALTSGQDISLSVGQRLVASVGKGISFFTQSLGIKLFAAKGKVEIQAQSDEIHIIAEKVMKLISAKAKIEVAAKNEILLTAGGSYIRINKAGIEEGTPGDWKAWAASHDLPGPRSLPMVERPEPVREYSNKLDDLPSN